MIGRTVVSNSGPLMALAKLNRLSLLKKLFQQVSIPQAVYEETVIRGMSQGYLDASSIKLFFEQQGWQAVYVDHGDIIKELLKEKLDWGEIESIQLAMNAKDALLLIVPEKPSNKDSSISHGGTRDRRTCLAADRDGGGKGPDQGEPG